MLCLNTIYEALQCTSLEGTFLVSVDSVAGGPNAYPNALDLAK